MTDERFRRLVHRVVAKASREASARLPLAGHQRVLEWNAIDGETLRLDYELGPDSLVFDLGGYRGQWASDIYARFRCAVHVFEPVPSFAEQIRWRFESNPDIVVHSFGLGARDDTIELGLDEDATSAYKIGSRSTSGEVRSASRFIEEMGSPEIDVLKMNIEGGEYDLLDHLIESGHITRARNVQVQFHDFAPDADRRMRRIQSLLARTHEPTWQVEFVFENWRIKEGPAVSADEQSLSSS